MSHDLGPSDAVTPPTIDAETARRALLDHAATAGARLRDRAGGPPNYPHLLRLLTDSDVVRFPVQVVFDAEPLQGEEVAYPLPVDGNPFDGFTMYVHPDLATRPDDAIAAILYALVVVNYGEAATGEAGEVFGAAALGLDRETYYRTVCRIADAIHGNS